MHVKVRCSLVTAILVGAGALTSGFTNSYSGQIWLDDVYCVGNESRLIDCPARPLGVYSCSHNEDAGVSCPPISIGLHEQVNNVHDIVCSSM